MVKVSFAPDAGFKERVEGGGVRRRANTGTSAAVRRCLSPSLLLSSPVEVMFFLWADRLPNANIVTRPRRCSLPSRPFGKNNETSSFWALPHYCSIWQTHTPLPLPSHAHFLRAKHTHALFAKRTENTLGYTFALFPYSFSCAHACTHTVTHLLGVIKQQIRVIGCWQGLTLKSAVVGRLPGRCSLLTKLVGLDRRGTTVLLSGDLEQP